MIKTIAVVASVGAILATSSAFAGTMGALGTDGWTGVVSISAGPAWTDSNVTQTFFLAPYTENTYDAIKKTKSLVSGELFLGGQTPFKRIFLWQAGIALVATSNATLNGDIWEGADPNFNNFIYSYQIRHAHVAVKTKFLLNNWSLLQPYISGSLGVGFNRANDFTSIAKLSEESPGFIFQSKTTTALTYTVGIGVQRSLTTNIHVNIGYEFTDWGQSSLSSAPAQTINSGLSLSHLYTNALQFGLTYTA